jgi:hypothetical protein
MKVTVEIDCTPEEARRFLGLPDLAPMQQAVMARMQQQALDAIAALSPEALLRHWAPLMPQSPEQLRATIASAVAAFAAPMAPPNAGDGRPRPE